MSERDWCVHCQAYTNHGTGGHPAGTFRGQSAKELATLRAELATARADLAERDAKLAAAPQAPPDVVEIIAGHLEREATAWDSLHIDIAHDFREAARLLRTPYVKQSLQAAAVIKGAEGWKLLPVKLSPEMVMEAEEELDRQWRGPLADADEAKEVIEGLDILALYEAMIRPITLAAPKEPE